MGRGGEGRRGEKVTRGINKGEGDRVAKTKPEEG